MAVALTVHGATASAESGWSIQRLLLAPDGRYPVSVKSVDTLDDKIGIAVGSGNQSSSLVATTNDGGRHWNSGYIDGQTGGLYKVHADATTGTAVGSGGTILRTADGGETWRQQVSATSADLLSVTYRDGVNEVFVGGVGRILRTVDGGETWRPQELPSVVDTYGWAGISFKGGNGVVVGSYVGFDRAILRTVTRGEPVTCSAAMPTIFDGEARR